MSKKLVIIGGLAAGMKAAAKARRENKDLIIEVYQDEENISYSRCGLPYFISGDIKEKNKLIIRKPEDMKEKNNINVFIKHKATKINPEKKDIIVKNLENNEEFNVKYDKLIISTGTASKIPDIEGINSKNIFSLRTIEDAEAIKEAAKESKKAVIIGAGFIGLEITESLKKLNLDVTLLAESGQVLYNFDNDVAYHIEKYIKQKGVRVITSEKILRIEADESGKVKKVITSNNEIDADIVIVAKGTKLNTEIAEEAGIEIGITGGIKVNSRMETNIPDIYAAGDCTEKTCIVNNKPVNYASGSLANLQGKIIAENISGIDSEFHNSLRSQIVKCFDMTIAKSGLSEKEAIRQGFDYEAVIVPAADRPEYYPGVNVIVIKMLADKKTKEIIGLQVYGEGDVSKRIDIGIVSMTMKMTLDQVGQADLSYAPPYTGPIDPIAHAANILENKIDGFAEGILPEQFKEKINKGTDNFVIIDIRAADDYKEAHIPGAINIPLERLNSKIKNLDKNKETIIHCYKGKTSYFAYRKLVNNGFTNVKYLDGGITTWIDDLVTV